LPLPFNKLFQPSFVLVIVIGVDVGFVIVVIVVQRGMGEIAVGGPPKNCGILRENCGKLRKSAGFW
jgi:hypothetical protein